MKARWMFWRHSLDYELSFWLNEWPYRHLPREVLVKGVRNDDASWFLRSMGFERIATNQFQGFEGLVLEVGSGPVGFFENICGVRVTAIDILMKEYAEQLPYAQLGTVNNTTYEDTPLDMIQGKFDFVVCSNVLDHTDDWQAFLRDLLRPLREDGELLLYTHCRYLPSPGHTQVFAPQDLYNQLWNEGSTIRSWKVVTSRRPFVDSECFARASSPTNERTALDLRAVHSGWDLLSQSLRRIVAHRLKKADRT